MKKDIKCFRCGNILTEEEIIKYDDIPPICDKCLKEEIEIAKEVLKTFGSEV